MRLTDGERQYYNGLALGEMHRSRPFHESGGRSASLPEALRASGERDRGSYLHGIVLVFCLLNHTAAGGIRAFNHYPTKCLVCHPLWVISIDTEDLTSYHKT